MAKKIGFVLVLIFQLATSLWGAEVHLVPRKVLIAVERSSETRWQMGSVRSFVLDVVDQLELGSEVALFEFAEGVTRLAHSRSLTLEHREAVKQRVPQTGSKEPHVNFNIVMNELVRDSQSPCFLVFISRGVSNPSSNHSFVDPLTLLEKRFPVKDGHSVLFVGLSDNIEVAFKRKRPVGNLSFLRLDTHLNRPTLILDRFLYARPKKPTVKPAVPRPIPTRRVVRRIPTEAPRPTSTLTVKPSRTASPTQPPTRSFTPSPKPTRTRTATWANSPSPTLTSSPTI
jgi:hypothetical protein